MEVFIADKQFSEKVCISHLYVSSDFNPEAFVVEGVPFYQVSDWVKHFIKDPNSRRTVDYEIAHLIKMIEFPTPGKVIIIAGIQGIFADLVGCRSLLADAMDRAYTLNARNPETTQGRKPVVIPIENDRPGWSEACHLSPNHVDLHNKNAGHSWTNFVEIDPSTLIRNRFNVYGAPLKSKLTAQGELLNADDLSTDIIKQYKRWHEKCSRKVVIKTSEEAEDQAESMEEKKAEVEVKPKVKESKAVPAEQFKLKNSTGVLNALLCDNSSLVAALLKGKKLVLTIGLE